ncbi:MAG TPA: hypothetical protein VE465_21340 [Streptosporangiaceae bacterium]|nr:hypothetical protein [Streptosporangiaceae bacterium]
MTDHAANADADAGGDAGGATPAEPERRCSAKGCGAAAAWAVRWRNPKIHGPERRKIWLACDDHRAYLSDFLGGRGFPYDVVPLADLD